MNERAHTQRLRGGILLYALSVISGLANFAALKILQHISPQESTYSQLSTILLSFTTFQLLTDLGTQTQFIQSYRSAPVAQRANIVHLLLQSRLTLGITAFLLALVYVFAADFSGEMKLSFLIYQAAFIPFAYMSSADTLFLAREEFGKAILSRITRIAALAAFLLAAAATQPHSLVAPAVASTFAFCGSAAITWFFSLKGHSASSAGAFAFLQWSWWNNPNAELRTFFKGSTLAGLVILLHFIQSFVAQIYLVRSAGEQSLSAINTALVIATPAILAFQTLGQMHIPAAADWATTRSAHFKPELMKFSFKMLGVLIVMIAGLVLAQTLGWVQWFFPLSNSEVVQLSFYYLLAHAILCFAAPLQVLCQYQGRAQVLITAFAGSVVLSWGCQFLLNPHSHEIALLLSLLLFAVLICSASLLISLQKNK